MLQLFAVNADYSRAIKHEVGRELCYDAFYLLSKNIELVPDKVNDIFDLGKQNTDIRICKKVLSNLCSIVRLNKEVKLEDGKDFFKKEEWYRLFKKCNGEKFRKERRAIEIGSSFYTAYKTVMGDAVEDCIKRGVQSGYKKVYNGNITIEEVYELNIYRVILKLWAKRRSDYKNNIERIRKIIYKEK
jgi:hypothetical protein